MELPQNQNQRQNPSIGLFLLYIFASVALIIFFGYPKYSDWRTATAAVTTSESKLATVTTEAAQVKSEMQAIQPVNAAQISDAVPSTPDLTTIYAQVESLANAATVHLISVQGIVDSSSAGSSAGLSGSSTGMSMSDDSAVPASGTSGSTPTGPIAVASVPSSLGTITLNIDVSGSYAATQQFLNSLYTSLRIMTVQQVILSSGKSGATSTTSNGAASSSASQQSIDLKAQVQTYYAK